MDSVNMDDSKGQTELSDRQKEILYTFEMLDTYGEDLYLDFSIAETETLLRECNNTLPKLLESQCPISADTWKGLGRIRDGLVKLLEEKLGADHNIPKVLKFNSLDNAKMGGQSRSMDLICQNVPSSIAEMARNAIAIIQDSMPGGIIAQDQLSDRQKQIMYTFSMLQTNGEDLDLKVSSETEALLRECENMLPKVLESQGPIDADTWEGLGKIRDGFVKLVEQSLGPDHEISNKLKFETPDSIKKPSLCYTVNIIVPDARSSVAEMATWAIATIRDIIIPGDTIRIPLRPKKAHESTIKEGILDGTSPMSARQKSIMYTLTAIEQYGESMSLQDQKVSPAVVEALMHECRNMLPKISDPWVPISDDVWEGLGKIRDGLLTLVQQNFGAEHNLSKVLNFDRLDRDEFTLLSRSMSRLWEGAPGYLSECAKNGISIIEYVLSDLDSTAGSVVAHNRLSARQKEILYTFDVLDTYGQDLAVDTSTAETEVLLRQCDRMLPKLSESQGPISADTWEGLGNIRDGLVELMQKKLGADHHLSNKLKFNSLDGAEMGSQGRSMDLICQNVPSSIAEMAKTAIAIIRDILTPLDSMPGGISVQDQLSDRQKQILYTFSMLDTYGEDLDLKVSPAETGALLRECQNMLSKLWKSQGPISEDTWKGLGEIRDGFVGLVEQKFEAGHVFPDKLKFETLDSMRRSSLSRSMNIIKRNAPSSTSDIAETAIVIIKDIIRPGGGITIPFNNPEAPKNMLKSDTTMQGELNGKSPMSARQRSIMCTLDVIDEYGSGVHLLLPEHNVSPAETEASLRECRNVLPRLSDPQVPISDDVWEGLGKIRDGLLTLVEQKLGAEHNLSKVLNFDRLDRDESTLLSRSMSRFWEGARGVFSQCAKNGVRIIEYVLLDLVNTPGESKAQEQMSAREVEVMYTFDHVSIYGSTLITLFQDCMASLQVTADADRLLRECREVLSKLSPCMEQISADVWEELGRVRDHFVSLVDEMLGLERPASKKLKLDSLDSKERSSTIEDRQLARACTSEFEATLICNSLHIVEAIYSDMVDAGAKSCV